MNLTNTSIYSDAQIKAFISFGYGRLPANCDVKIVQRRTSSLWSRGCAWNGYRRVSLHRKPVLRGGAIFVRSSREHRQLCDCRDHGPYLAYRAYGSLEEFVFVLWHECRHVYQGYGPMFRECRRVRRHRLGNRARLTEIDAQLFAIRALRRFRREWPDAAKRVLPLP